MLDLKSSSKQIFLKIDIGCPCLTGIASDYLKSRLCFLFSTFVLVLITTNNW